MEEREREPGAGIAVELRAVRRVFEGGVVAIDGIDLRVEAGQFLAILGPSGCGKSTLLRLIAGLDRPTQGAIGRGLEAAPAAEHAPIAYVFQDAHLLPWRNVLHNVALPLELRGIARARRLDAARDAIDQVGLVDAIDRYPAQLSGGQRQRVSLMRALMLDPAVLLLDEPLGALDPMIRADLQTELRSIFRSLGKTVVLVTHDLAEAAYFADHIALLDAGRVAQTGTLDDFARNPASPFVTRFLQAQRSLHV